MTHIDSTAVRIIGYGADIAGATAGFALEHFGKVPAGAGGPIASLVSSTLKEMGARTLSRRELARVGAASAFALDRISARLINGDQLREDDFRYANSGSRAPSVELFEAVVLKARDAYEERKVRHIGLLFANTIFVQNVSFETANLLIRTLERMSYRQICLLALIAKSGSYDMEALRHQNHCEPDAEALKREEMDLHGNDLGTLGLVHGKSSWTDELSTLGTVLCELADFEQIPNEELEPIKYQIAKLTTVFKNTSIQK